MGRGLFGLLLLFLASASAAEPPVSDAPGLTGLKTRIETPRYDETVAFYRDLLGLHIVDSWDNDGDRGTILGLQASARGQAFLEVAYAADAVATEAISLQFRVTDLDAVARRLRGHREFRGPEERPWGSTYLYLHDPAGTKLIIYQGEL